MTEIYTGTGWGKSYIGYCENGDIYLGSGWGKTHIGVYKFEKRKF